VRYFFEHLGVGVFGVTGVLAGKNKRVDLFGVIVLALVTALGGGTLRDLILRTDPFWMSDMSFVLTASATAAVTFVAARCWEPPASLFLVVDACGLALFTMLGTEKALNFSTSNIAAIVLGVRNGRGRRHDSRCLNGRSAARVVHGNLPLRDGFCCRCAAYFVAARQRVHRRCRDARAANSRDSLAAP
jgi:glycine transporter